MKKIFKQENGVTMMDIAIAIVILCLFAGIIGRIYYRIAYNNAMIKLNAIATYYVVQIAEDIDRIAYDEVESKSNSELKEELIDRFYDRNESFEVWPDNLIITLTVTNYNEDDPNKMDIIKKVNIKAVYEVFENEEDAYSINLIKVKER